MELQTKVNITDSPFKLDYASKVVLVGSCFVENMGERLKYYKFDADVNPCGIVYNPLSIAHVLDWLMEGKKLTEKDLVWNNDLWVSLLHHGSFSAADASVCLDRINRRLEYSAGQLRNADLLVLTFGTSWVYRHLDRDMIVSNCHKIPSEDFERFRLKVDDIVRVYTGLIGKLRDFNPGIKILFTVSPIRHWKDGAHGNQLSKACLLLAIDELADRFKCTGYFPSYEIVMDELRDYRFYAGDMLHVSDVAAGYVWERFKQVYISDGTEGLMKRIDKVNRSLAHRPVNIKSESYRALLDRLAIEIEEIAQRLPTVCFEAEREKIAELKG